MQRAPVGIDLLPEYAYVSPGAELESPNGISHRFSNLVSREIAGVTWQVATYISAANDGICCVRQLPFGAWKSFNLGPNYITADDGHNTFPAGIDADGYVHFSYDHHNNPLHYRRSDAPLATWTGGVTALLPMLGANETYVTYPQFIPAPTGELYFHFRDGVVPTGGSGDGVNRLYKYDESTTSWSPAPGTGSGGIYFDGFGSSTTYSLYPNRPWVFSSDWDGAGTGFMLITGTARRDYPGDTNNNLYCLKYTGVAFTHFDGTAQAIPATFDNLPPIIAVPESDYLVNDCGQCLDANNVPHLSYYKKNGSGIHQLWHAWHNGTAWVEHALTSWASISTGFERGRPSMECDRDTNTIFIWYTAPAATTDNQDGIFEYASDPSDFSTWTRRTFYNGPCGGYEVRQDQALWIAHKLVSILVVFAKDATDRGEVPRIITRAPAGVSTDFVEADWSRKHEIVVQASAVGAGGVAGFSPVFTAANFPDEVRSPTDDNRAEADGGSLRFFLDSGLTIEIPCVIEKWGYDSVHGAGDADISVRLGPVNLSDVSDTPITLASGNAAMVQPFVTDTYGAKSAVPANEERYLPLQRNGHDVADPDEYAQKPFDGNALEYDATGAVFDPADNAPLVIHKGLLGVSSSFAISAVIDVPATLSDDAQIFAADGSAADRVLQFRVRNNSAPLGVITAIRFDGAGGSLGALLGATDLRGAGKKHVVLQWDSTTGEKIYVSGAVDASSSNTSVGAESATAIWCVGGRVRDDGVTLDDLFEGPIGHVQFHSVARNDAWWATTAAMFESPATFAVPGASSNIGNVETVVNDPEAFADPDTGAITQDHSASANDAEALADADTGAITQYHNAAASDAEAVADADAVAIAQDHNLVVDEAEATAAPDSAAIGGSANTVVDEPEATGDVDAGAITQDHNLVVDEPEAIAAPDSAAIGGSANTSVDEAEAVADVDAGAISQDHNTAASDPEAQGDVDTGAISVSGGLLADDPEAQGDVDTGGITQEHNLVVDEAEARADVPAVALLLDGIGVVYQPQLIDVTPRRYLIDPKDLPMEATR